MTKVLRLVLLTLALWPSIASAMEPSVLVVSQSAGVLSAVTPDGRTLGTLALDKAPAAITVDPKDGRAYVSHPDLGRISVIDIARWRVERAIPVGGQPFGLALSGDGRLLVTDWSADTLAVIKLSGEGTDHIRVGRSPSAVVVDRAAGLAYCVNRESDSVTVIDLRTLTVTNQIATGHAPFAAALSPDGGLLYVANVQSGDLSVINTKTGRETARIDIGGMPYGVAVDGAAVDEIGERVLVTDQQGGKLAIIAPETPSVVERVRVGDYAEAVVTMPNTGLAVVANWFSDNLSVIDLKTLKVSTIAVAAGPRMLAISSPLPE